LATDAVKKLPHRIFNAAGRGYPDIAALAHNFYIQISGNVGSEDGTSASSPVIAGIIGTFLTCVLRAACHAVDPA
jgi:tripeptidyl-peptidase-1